MTKKKNLKINNFKGKYYLIIVAILIIAFLALLLANLFTKKNNINYVKSPNQHSDIYNFTKQGELTFQNSTGNFITSIDIEFADNQNERAQGLMYRTKLDENQGMLFVFPFEEFQSFWMKNTVLPLDMLFINSELKIVTIHKNTEPYSTKGYPSSSPAIYVLEVNAGFTDKYNIKQGDKVIFRRIK